MNTAKAKRVKLQDIFARYGAMFRAQHTLSQVQLKAMRDIEGCGTPAMGYHTYYCDQCGHTEVAYNSCRNRHCPRCQWLKQQLWVDVVKSQLLPVGYFHVVFTLPESLNPLVMINHKLMYDHLFEASWHAMRQAAHNPAFLGAGTGAVAILHTWGQTLSLHPHVHMLVPSGGLDADGWQWVKSGKKFFVPVKALSKMFRAKFLQLLTQSIEETHVTLPANVNLTTYLGALKTVLCKTDWVVYCKKCFAGPGQVITYLGRYTHRVAISENRITGMDDNHILFNWKDYRDNNRWKKMSLTPDEFIRRFMLHILPPGFYKIRYFGIYAVANRQTKLMQCFCLLRCTPLQTQLQGLGTATAIQLLTGKRVDCCPVCKLGTMRPLRPPGQWF